MAKAKQLLCFGQSRPLLWPKQNSVLAETNGRRTAVRRLSDEGMPTLRHYQGPICLTLREISDPTEIIRDPTIIKGPRVLCRFGKVAVVTIMSETKRNTRYCLEWELHGTPSNKRGQSFASIGIRAHTFAKLLNFLVITIV